jgi:transcriptional regulator of arginine metabolism
MSNLGASTHKSERQRAILELITRSPIANQDELVERLRDLGHVVTQATVSRDIAELGLAKVARGEHHVYVSPDDLGPAGPTAPAPIIAPRPATPADDARLRRIIADHPVAIARSGLTLVLRSGPGSANTIAQAIDQSSLDDQVGTLAGDDTVLVLFGDEARLDHWLNRFRVLQAPAPPGPPPLQAALIPSSMEHPQ